MKFHQLPVGRHFRYQQKRYCKTSPLAATAEDGGQRMIPRAARVEADDAPSSTPETSDVQSPLLDALHQHHQQTIDLFDEATAQLPEVQRQALRTRLDDNYRALLAGLEKAD